MDILNSLSEASIQQASPTIEAHKIPIPVEENMRISLSTQCSNELPSAEKKSQNVFYYAEKLETQNEYEANSTHDVVSRNTIINMEMKQVDEELFSSFSSEEVRLSQISEDLEMNQNYEVNNNNFKSHPILPNLHLENIVIRTKQPKKSFPKCKTCIKVSLKENSKKPKLVFNKKKRLSSKKVANIYNNDNIHNKETNSNIEV